LPVNASQRATATSTNGGACSIAWQLDTYSHAIPAMQEEEALIAGLVFTSK
jgi:hypothetical protein